MTVPATVSSYFNKRSVRDNWLIGRGVMLSPPVSASVTASGTRWSVTVTGGNGRYTRICDEAVAGQYREELLLIDTSGPTPDFCRLVPFQAARVSMLNTISPGATMSRDEFRDITRKADGNIQGEATRRWRELGLEFGFDTNYDQPSGEYHRGVTLEPVREPLPRPNMKRLSAVMVPAILARGDEETCAKCGREIDLPYAGTEDHFPGVVDHRRPVAYGGSDELDNLQLLCRQCNNVKAHTCKRCPLNYECGRCTWAFPRQFHDTVTVYLNPDEVAVLQARATVAGEAPDDHARRLLRDELTR